jgi:hypothetical protein
LIDRLSYKWKIKEKVIKIKKVDKSKMRMVLKEDVIDMDGKKLMVLRL